MKLNVVDFFSGLGGFTEAFLQRGHTVTRYDFNTQFQDVPNTIIADLMKIKIKDIPKKPDILAMSPPCNCFSPMTIPTYWIRGKPKPDRKEVHAAIALVKRALYLKDKIKPRFWILENPAGMLRHVIGRPAMLTWWGSWGGAYLKPTHLWGLLPNIEWPPKSRSQHEPCPRGAQMGIQDSKLTPAERALIPYTFSEALCIALERGDGGQTALV